MLPKNGYDAVFQESVIDTFERIKRDERLKDLPIFNRDTKGNQWDGIDLDIINLGILRKLRRNRWQIS